MKNVRLAVVAVFVIVGFLRTPATALADVEANSPVASALKRADDAVAKIVAIPTAERNFDNTVGAIDDLITRLQTDTNMTMFLSKVSPDAEVRKIGQQAEEDIGNWIIVLTKREDLYQAVKAVSMLKVKLEGEKKRLLDFYMRDFRRSGMELTPEQREELKKNQMEANKLSIQFGTNIDEDSTYVPLTVDELTGMPEDFMTALESVRSENVFLVPMNPPAFNAIMDHCPQEITRQKCWLAWKRRGGEKNVDILQRIIKLRAEASKLLGYKTTADFEEEVRMSKDAATVMAFYDKLRPLVRPKAQMDYNEYLAAKRAHTGNASAKFYPWDQPFYEKKLMKEKYAVDSNKVQEYFPMERVVEGLFSITQSLYGIEYREVTDKASSMGKPLWHKDVRLYDVYDKVSKEKLGEFYTDMYPRENKYNHAAQWGLADHKVYNDGTVQKPIAALVCNFTEPTPEKPSLLTHEEVETFFHEFGHCLHTILSEVHYGYFSGCNVERDLVEAPSQMFENWVWDADVLKTFAKHYKTGEPFPDALLRGMIKGRYLGSGLFAEHQFYYGLTDLAYHMAPDGVVDTTRIAVELFPQVELYEAVPQSLYQASFSHLVGYQAGYYSYQWSLVYAQDMFQRFKEKGLLNPEAGMYYRKKFLSRGGTIDGLDLVKEFLGREPKMDAYLEHLGLKK